MIVEIELIDRFSEHVAIGNKNTTESDIALRQNKIFIAALTNHPFELIESGARADNGEPIVRVNHRRIGCDHGFCPMADPCNSYARFNSARNRIETNSLEIRILD